MGSFFAGVKAGTLSGLVYLGGFALFNVAMLYLFKADTLNVLSTSYRQYCASTTAVNGTLSGSAQDCFDSVVTVLIPFAAVLAFFVSLFYAGIFGWLYEYFPGKGPSSRGATLGVVVGLNLLLIGLTGIYFDAQVKIAVILYFIASTFAFGVMTGRLYRRYTKEVRFVGDEGVRIRVGRRDFTGRTVTFATKSTHAIRAETSAGTSFRGWAASGGAKVEDPGSMGTSMDVEGDGMLKAQASKG